MGDITGQQDPLAWRKSPYRKSSHSGGGNCVEVAFAKSSHSTANGACVEVGNSQDGMVHVRDSKNPAAGTLAFTPAEWAAFLAGVRSSR